MNHLSRILLLSHVGTALCMYGAAQPARESQVQEFVLYSDYDKGIIENIALQKFIPNLKKIIIRNRINPKAWPKLIEELGNAPHIEILEIEFDSIKELTTPPQQKRGFCNFCKSLFTSPLQEEISTLASGTQKCAELLTKLPHLRTLRINAQAGHGAYLPWLNIFAVFAQTNIQQIDINDSKEYVGMESKGYSEEDFSDTVTQERASHEVKKNTNEKLTITVDYIQRITYVPGYIAEEYNPAH